MRQPDLGKKIAELRKAKGLTQEELVEKCNLNVRTLQRIESGEVTPRSYTIKAIFTALDYNVYDPSEITINKFREPGFIGFSWLEQFYKYFIDLFNLNTHTMKKISILTIMLSVIVFVIFAVGTTLSAQNSDLQKQKNKKTEKIEDRELAFTDFSCYGCTEKKGLMIGRDVSFKLNGVKVTGLRLIVIDKVTREFDALFVVGKFSERMVEVEYPKDMLIDSTLNYSADNIKKSDSKIFLKGKSKLTDINDKDNPNDDETIEADEITITLK